MTLSDALKRVHSAMDKILWGENQPQWAGAFAHVRHRIRIDAGCETAYIDAKGNITIGLTLASTLPLKQLGYVIAHEVSHPMLDHFQRMPTGANAELWNIAGDCVINGGIFADGGDDALPSWVVTTPEEYTGPIATEAIYAWFRRNPSKTPQVGQDSNGKPLPGAGCGTEPSASEDGAEGEVPSWGQIVAQAKAIEAVVGKGSAMCSVIAPAKPFYNFAQLLRFGTRQADAGAGRSERTYARASRRDFGSGIVSPGHQGGAPRFAIVADASTSMERGWIARVAGEIRVLAKEFARTKFYLIVHTDRVVWQGWIDSKNASAKIPEALAFSGGTKVGPTYTELARVAPRWDVILHFTDCEVERPWPNAPTSKLIIGAFGLSAFQPWSTPPKGAQVIACRDIEGIEEIAA